jgi:Ca-activated chloride channel family protein
MKNRMFFKLLAGWIISMAVLFFLVPVPVFSAEFSADLVITAPDGNYTFKLYVKDNMYRLEKVKGGMKFPPFPTIVNRDTGLTWGLNLQARQYVEMKDIRQTMMMNPIPGWEMMRKDYKKKAVGSKTVSGYVCDKFVYHKPGKSKTEAALWISKKLDHFIKQIHYATNGNAVMELKNISKGPVNEALFKIPAGYSKMSAGGPGASAGAARAPQPAKKAKASVSGSASAGNVMFILDASGSMWGQVEGKAKIAIAKEVLVSLIKDLPDDLHVGLVAYGHRRKGDCNDVEELVPLSVLDKKKLIKKIQAISPKGKTPITLSVRKTAEKLKELEDETTIILVSDGKETCAGDPCALVKELFVMHVIGFDVTEEEREQLECMAKAGGGTYYTAKNAKDFQMAAKEVVKKAQNFGFLRVTSLKAGKPFRATMVVSISGEKKSLFTTGTVTDPKKKGSKLKPGTYDIRVIDRQVQSRPEIKMTGIEIEPGKTVEKSVDFSGGTLKVAVVKNEKPSFGRIYVNKAGTKKRIAGSDTSTANPQTIHLEPGTYDVLVVDESVRPKQIVTFLNLSIENGQVIDKKADFLEGILKVRIFKNGKESHGRCIVYNAERTKRLTGVTGDSPHTYKLSPGVYQVDVMDEKIRPKPTVTFADVQIQGNQTVEKKAEFNPGYLQITAKRDGKVVQASAYIYDASTNKRVRGANTSGRPTLQLLPGVYNVTFADSWGTKKKVKRSGIRVEAGKTSAVQADFMEPEPVQKAAPAPAHKPAPALAPVPSTAKVSKLVKESTQQPEKIFRGEVPIYKGAKVTKASTIGTVTQVNLLSDASPEEIVNFYKKAMQKRGWKVIMAMARGNTASSAYNKGKKQLIIAAQKRNVGTVISMTMR